MSTLKNRLLAFLLPFICILVGFAQAKEQRPNVLLITADDLGLQLSCYGEDQIETPNIDALAARSVQFKTAYVSQASCSPSRSSLFTGMYPHGNGHYGLANANVGFQVHEELFDRLLPNVLKSKGYRTGIIGKLHVNPEKEFAFDVRYREGFGSRDIRQQIGFAKEFLNGGYKSAGSGPSSKANEKIKEPWFLMFNVFDPHVARKNLGKGKRGPQYFPDTVKGLPKNPLSASDVRPWPWQGIDNEAQLTKIAGYYNCVRRIDTAIGMLMDLLEESEQLENTLIIFLGDHGPPFARGKTSCYEAGLRVPFLVHWPSETEPHVSESLVSSVDIYPTILDATGSTISADVHGKSLRPLMNPESSVPWRRTLVGEFHYHGASPFFPRRAITDGRYKLIHNIRAGQLDASNSVDGDQAPIAAKDLPAGSPARIAMQRLAAPPEFELYDLKADPIEFNNLAEQPELRNVREKLNAALQDWQTKTNDPFRSAEFRSEIEAKYRSAAAQ